MSESRNNAMSTVVKEDDGREEEIKSNTGQSKVAPSTTMSPFLAKISIDEEREWKMRLIKSKQEELQ